jgi:hypothetical protein
MERRVNEAIFLKALYFFTYTKLSLLFLFVQCLAIRDRVMLLLTTTLSLEEVLVADCFPIILIELLFRFGTEIFDP